VNCSDYKKAILEESGSRRPDVSNHARGCDDCREFARSVKNADAVLSAKFGSIKPEIPRNFHTDFLSALSREKAHVRAVRPFARRGAMAWVGAAAVIVLAVAVLLPRHAPKQVAQAPSAPNHERMTRENQPPAMLAAQLPNVDIPNPFRRDNVIQASGTKYVFEVASSFAGNATSALNAFVHEKTSQ